MTTERTGEKGEGEEEQGDKPSSLIMIEGLVNQVFESCGLSIMEILCHGLAIYKRLLRNSLG